MFVRRSANIVMPIDDILVDQDHSPGVGPEVDFAAQAAPKRLSLEKRQRKSVAHSWPEPVDNAHLDGLKLAGRPLREPETRYREFFEDAPVGMFQMSPNGQLFAVNRAMARILGFKSAEQLMEEAAKRDAAAIFGTDLLDDQKLPGGESPSQSGVDLQVRCRNGEKKWVRLNLRKVRDGGRLVRLEGTGEDVTDRKLAEIRTELLAYYDLLTGLPNRTLFHELLAGRLATAGENGRRIALLLVELQGFKVINDSLGVVFGDRLLQEIAARLRAETADDCAVGRVGGAEFAIILPDVDDVCRVKAKAETLVAKLNADYSFLGHSLTVFCNAGISIFPENGTDFETLMKRSDVAMCRAREDSVNRFTIFTEEMNKEMVARLRLENGLREVLKRNELFLEYQPQVDMRTGAITGLESLLRWNHRELGLIPPNDFIGIAENSGLIVSIGEWVLRSACTQVQAWQRQGLPVVPVAVNVSAIQFRQQGFCELVGNVLLETGLRPELLELELTESLLTNADVVAPITAGLRDLGVTLAIDDFGTGYSSLGYLKNFKVNRLKIDRSFIKDVSVDADDAAITIAIIEMARALNLAVLAEGVEEESQLSFLRRQECYTIQGFYFSRPASADKIAQLLRTGFRHRISVGVA
jgi:diguanylate cyclase (GGDEF)-like protein/PAS domain S-box-containing protein